MDGGGGGGGGMTPAEDGAEGEAAASGGAAAEARAPAADALAADAPAAETPAEAEAALESPPPGLDALAFPRFEPLLLACQDYAVLSGCRFRLLAFGGRGGAEGYGSGGADPTAQQRWAAAIASAEYSVHDFAARVRSGDGPLLEEIERASRIVMAESVRNAMVAMLRKLDMWPPPVPPMGVEDTDCSYQDTSAALEVIAQRCYNDEARRQCSESLAGVTHRRRAATASFLVDFAHEVIGSSFAFVIV